MKFTDTEAAFDVPVTFGTSVQFMGLPSATSTAFGTTAEANAITINSETRRLRIKVGTRDGRHAASSTDPAFNSRVDAATDVTGVPTAGDGLFRNAANNCGSTGRRLRP